MSHRTAKIAKQNSNASKAPGAVFEQVIFVKQVGGPLKSSGDKFQVNDILLFQNGLAFNLFLVPFAKTLGLRKSLELTFEQCQNNLKYLVVSSKIQKVSSQSIARFKKLELVWFEVNLASYPGGTTWEEAMDKERKSLEHWFELANMGDAHHRIPDIVLVERKVIEDAGKRVVPGENILADKDKWVKVAKDQKEATDARLQKKQDAYLKRRAEEPAGLETWRKTEKQIIPICR
jgi:hypothetical protein